MTPTPEEVLARHTFEGELWVPDNLRGAQSVCRDLYAAVAASQERVQQLEKQLSKERQRGRIRARIIEVYYRCTNYFVGRYSVYDRKQHDKTPYALRRGRRHKTHANGETDQQLYHK